MIQKRKKQSFLLSPTGSTEDSNWLSLGHMSILSQSLGPRGVVPQWSWLFSLPAGVGLLVGLTHEHGDFTVSQDHRSKARSFPKEPQKGGLLLALGK